MIAVPIDTLKEIPNGENVVSKDNIVGDTFIPYRGTAVMLAYNSETVENPACTVTSCTNGSRTIPAVSPTATRPPAAPAIPL
ncbi:MAG: hypothetical protein ACLVEX_14435 [Ruthenibacterium lactatiformans]